MTIKRRHWLVATMVALTAHGTLVLTLWKPAESGAANLGVGGMEISFGAAGGAPGANEVTAPETKPVEAREVAAETPPEPAAEPVETVEAAEPLEKAPTPPQVADAVPVEEVKPRLEKLKPPKKPRPPEVKKPVTPAPAAPPREIAAAEPAPPKTARKPQISGASGRAGTKESANVGSRSETSSGGLPGSSNSYFALLQAWLEKHKEYPAQARRRRDQGTAVLTFTMVRDGTIETANVTRSSGSAQLDQEVLAMIGRASPSPPFPDDFDRQRITLSVPVQFQLR
jgi:protein TonB